MKDYRKNSKGDHRPLEPMTMMGEEAADLAVDMVMTAGEVEEEEDMVDEMVDEAAGVASEETGEDGAGLEGTGESYEPDEPEFYECSKKDFKHRAFRKCV